MRSMLLVLATAVGMALLTCGVAAASITLFEPLFFHLGSVNGQSGVGACPWKSAPRGAINCVDWPVKPNPTTPGQYDQEVVANSCRSSWRSSWVRQSIVAYFERMCVW